MEEGNLNKAQLRVMLTILLIGMVNTPLGVNAVGTGETISHGPIQVESQPSVDPQPPSGKSIDLYAAAENEGYGSYPDPFPALYGGQGHNNPMDIVLPQSEMMLYANVTDNGVPLPSVKVKFRIEGPYERSSDGVLSPKPRYSILAILESTTAENGTASAGFRMPWPVDGPDWILGVWLITAEASVSSERLLDSMPFYYERLIYIISVTTDKYYYDYQEYVNVNVEYQTHAIREYPALFQVVITDSKVVPFGISLYSTTVGRTPLWTWNKSRFDVSIFVPKWTYRGIECVHVNVYDKDPTIGGFLWTQEYSPAPVIRVGIVPGDVNMDGVVDMEDVGAVAAAFGSNAGMPRYSIESDVYYDGKINMKDFYMVCRHFGQRYQY